MVNRILRITRALTSFLNDVWSPTVLDTVESLVILIIRFTTNGVETYAGGSRSPS